MQVNLLKENCYILNTNSNSIKDVNHQKFQGIYDKNLLSCVRQQLTRHIDILRSIQTQQKSVLRPKLSIISEQNTLEQSNPFVSTLEGQSDKNESQGNIVQYLSKEDENNSSSNYLSNMKRLHQNKQNLQKLLKSIENIQIPQSVKEDQQKINLLNREIANLKDQLKRGEQSQLKFKQKCQSAFNQYSKQLNKEKLQLKQLNKQLQQRFLQRQKQIKIYYQKLNHESSQMMKQKSELQRKLQQSAEKTIFLQLQLKQKNQIIQTQASQLKKSQQNYILNSQIQNNKVLSLNKQLRQLNDQQNLTINQLNIQNLKLNQQLLKLKESLSLKQNKNGQKNADEVRYLKEQNQYLRDQILCFKNTKKELQDNLSHLEKRYSKAKDEILELSQQLIVNRESVTKLQLQVQFKQNKIAQQVISKYQIQKQQYQASCIRQIQQLYTQLNQLKQELNVRLKHQQSPYNSRQQQQVLKDQIQFLMIRNQDLESELENTQSQLQKMKQEYNIQLELYAGVKSAYDAEMMKFEEASLQANKIYNNKFKMIQQNYHKNWNSLNEQLMQQKFANSVLQQKLKSLQSVQKRQREQCNEIKLLKQQVQLLCKFSSKNMKTDQKLLQLKTNKFGIIEYYLTKIIQQNRKLQQQFDLFRNIVKQSIKELYLWMQKTILQFHQHYRTKTSSFEQKSDKKIVKGSKELREVKQINQLAPIINIDLIQTYEQYKKNTLYNQNQSISKQTTINRGVTMKNIKKTLKNIQTRYNSANQQTKFYSSHLDNLIKKI